MSFWAMNLLLIPSTTVSRSQGEPLLAVCYATYPDDPSFRSARSTQFWSKCTSTRPIVLFGVTKGCAYYTISGAAPDIWPCRPACTYDWPKELIGGSHIAVLRPGWRVETETAFLSIATGCIDYFAAPQRKHVKYFLQTLKFFPLAIKLFLG